MSDLRTHMDISSIEDVIRYNHLHWFGHLQRMDEKKWPTLRAAQGKLVW